MKQPLQRLRFHRFSAVQLLIALGLFFTFAPFVEEIKGGDLIIAILLSLVLISGVVAVAARKRIFFIAPVLVTPALVSTWMSYFWPDVLPPAVFLGAGLRLVAFAVADLVRLGLRGRSVKGEVLCASLAAYRMLGWLSRMAYWHVDQLTAGGAFSFSRSVRT